MGYGLCAGIVASLVRGKTGRAVVVTGDGGIQHFGPIGAAVGIPERFKEKETQSIRIH